MNLTIFEHGECEFDWSVGDAAALERIRAASGCDVLVPTFRRGRKVLVAKQHVGVVRLRGRTIRILPKIHRSRDAAMSEQEVTANLLHLLEWAGDVPIREQGRTLLRARELDWFEVLTRLFATHLMEEWERGAHRTYERVEETSAALRGSWRIAEQLRRPEAKHFFFVAHDQFTADNPLNRVFRFVAERLFKLTRDARNRQMLGELRQWMDEVTLPGAVRASDAAPSLLTRLNARFAPLLNLARLFLDGGALQLCGGGVDSFAFVFDMNRLFEAFVINFIRRNRERILPVELAACELLPQSSGAGRDLARRAERGVFRLKPDLALRLGRAFPLLLDAKYKRLDLGKTDFGIGREDFYQMYAYARRYECPRVVMVYPRLAEMEEEAGARFELCDVGDECREVLAMTLDLAEIGSLIGRMTMVERLRAGFAGELKHG